jgi:hypothetical protein
MVAAGLRGALDGRCKPAPGQLVDTFAKPPPPVLWLQALGNSLTGRALSDDQRTLKHGLGIQQKKCGREIYR